MEIAIERGDQHRGGDEEIGGRDFDIDEGERRRPAIAEEINILDGEQGDESESQEAKERKPGRAGIGRDRLDPLKGGFGIPHPGLYFFTIPVHEGNITTKTPSDQK